MIYAACATDSASFSSSIAISRCRSGLDQFQAEGRETGIDNVVLAGERVRNRLNILLMGTHKIGFAPAITFKKAARFTGLFSGSI
jgi:hypothetical protein